MQRSIHLAILLSGLLSFASPVLAQIASIDSAMDTAKEQATSFDADAALRRSQQAIDRELGEYQFANVHGQSINFSQYRGKPLVISLVYTSCYHVCSMTTRHLAKAVRKAREALGEDSFRVITLGFDTAVDNPNAMRLFAAQQSVNLDNWDFLSSDAQTMQRLSQDLGFTYHASPKGYDHLIQATVINAEGRIYRQVYGELIDTPLMVEPLKELVFGVKPNDDVLTHWVNKLRLFCTTYDPSTDAYRFDYSLFIGMFIGATIIGSGVFFLLREFRRGPPFPPA